MNKVTTLSFFIAASMYAAIVPCAYAQDEITGYAESCSLIDGVSVSNGAELDSAKTTCAKGVYEYLNGDDFEANDNLITADRILLTILSGESISSDTATSLADAIRAKSTNAAQTAEADIAGAGCLSIDGKDESGNPIPRFTLLTSVASCRASIDTYLTERDFAQNPTIPRQDEIKERIIDNRGVFSHRQSLDLARLIDEKNSQLTRDRDNLESTRFVKGCFNQSGEKSGYQNFLNNVFDTCRIRASNTPNTLETNQPASFSYTANLDGDDSFAIQSAFRGGRTLGDFLLSANLQYARNNQQTQQQANLTTGLSLNYRLAPSSTNALQELEAIVSPTREDLDKFLTGFHSVDLEFDLDYNRMGIFGDAGIPACEEDPSQPFCGRQNLESLRLTGSAAPYLTFLNGTLFAQNSADNSWPWAISPFGELFYDIALNDNVVAANGNVVDGNVFGLRSGLTAAIAPGFFRNRIEFSTTAQIVHAISRDTGRISTVDAFNFEETTHLFTASAQLALADGAFVGQSTGNNIIPIISVTFTNGSDPLNGRPAQNTFLFGLAIEY